jgi:hypothetical protein
VKRLDLPNSQESMVVDGPHDGSVTVAKLIGNGVNASGRDSAV